MKWAVVILGGAADEPLPELEGDAPLEAAETPNLDRLASIGRVGSVATIPQGALADPAMGTMALLGRDVDLHWPGRGVIEALAAGVETPDDSTIFRVDLVRTGDDGAAREPDVAGVLLDPAPVGLTKAETRALLATVEDAWRGGFGEASAGLRLSTVAPGVGVLVDRGALLDAETITHAPAAAVGRDWRRRAPAGRKADAALALMELSAAALAESEVNRARAASGLPMANLAWLWGAGRRTPIPSLTEEFALDALGAGSSSGFLGVSQALGLARARAATVRGLASLESVADAALAGLEQADLVVAHTDLPDRAARERDFAAKIEAIEAADERLVGPILEALQRLGGEDLKPANVGDGGWRLLVCCDCASSTRTGAWLDEPTPFVMGGAWTPAVVRRRFLERSARESDLFVDRGCDLLEYFLFGGLKGVASLRKNRTAKR